HPDVEIRLEQIEQPEELRRLRSGDLDLAVVFRVAQPTDNGGPQPDHGLDEVHLADDPYRVVLPPMHPLARRRELRLADLAGEPFTAPPAGGFFPYRAMLEQICADAGFEPNIAHDVHDVTAARAFPPARLAIATSPELALPPPHQDVAVRPPHDIQPSRSLHATWLRGRKVPSAAPMVRYLADAATARLR